MTTPAIGGPVFCQRWLCRRPATHVERRFERDRWTCEQHASHLALPPPRHVFAAPDTD